MRVTPIWLPGKGGKMVMRYLAEARVGRVVVSVTGHTHAYAIHKAFQQILRPF